MAGRSQAGAEVVVDRGGNDGERIGGLSAGGEGGEVEIRGGGRGPIEVAIPAIVRVRRTKQLLV
jgi:hypothetical protein